MQYVTFKNIFNMIKKEFGFVKYDKKLKIHRMRHLAHILEKSLENKENPDFYKDFNENCFIELKKLIEEWEENNIIGHESEFRWVKKLFNEYINHKKTGWICVLLQKPRTRIPGIKEIYEKNNTNSQVAEIDLLKFIKGRRSIREWKKKIPSKECIDLILEAGLWAPSSCNRQTTEFIVIEDEHIKKKVVKGGKGVRMFMDKAPIVIVVLNDSRAYMLPDEQYVLYQDAAAVIQNISLMAERIGLGTCWGTFVSDSGQLLGESKIRQILKVPKFMKFSGILGVGYPDMQVCRISRRDIQESTSWIKK